MKIRPRTTGVEERYLTGTLTPSFEFFLHLNNLCKSDLSLPATVIIVVPSFISNSAITMLSKIPMIRTTLSVISVRTTTLSKIHTLMVYIPLTIMVAARRLGLTLVRPASRRAPVWCALRADLTSSDLFFENAKIQSNVVEVRTEI